MSLFQYPKGMIPMTGGFVKNDPSDTYPMGIARDLYGGFKVASTIDDMLGLHPNYLLPGYTACLVLGGTEGGVELYYLQQTPSNSDSTLIEDWQQSELGGVAESALKYKGAFYPSSYTIYDSDSNNEAGDLYIVNIDTADTSVIITDTDLFNGNTTTVYQGDWVLFNGTSFEHISQQVSTLVTWDTLAGKPKILDDYINKILPSHTHGSGDIEVNKQIDSTTYQYLYDLLNVVVYSNSIATSVTDAQSFQLLTLAQLEEKFVTNDSLSTDLNTLIQTELQNYYTKTEVDNQLNNKQDILTNANIKTMLEANPDTNTLTDSELSKVQNVSAAAATAKIILYDVIARDGGIINKIEQSDIPEEFYITEFASTGSVVRCIFRFSTMASLYGSFLINGMSFDSVARVGISEIFEGIIDIDITGLENIQVTGDIDLIIPIATTPNMISSVTLPALTAPKTHYYKGEVITLEVTTDSDDVNYIQVTNGVGIANKAKLPVTTTNGVFTVDVEVIHEGGIDVANCTLTPYKGDTLGKSFVVTDIPVDNTTPTLESSITYLNGFQALKDAEAVDIDLTGLNYDTINVSTINTSYLQIDASTLSKVTLSRVGGDNLITVVGITSVRDSNQKSVTINQDVVIYNILPTPLASVQEVRSGQDETIDLVADSTKLLNVTNPVSEAGTVRANTPTITFYADDTIPHDSVDITISYDYTTIAGKTGSSSRDVNIIGFAERTETLTYPAFELSLPFDFRSVYELNISGTIESTPPFEITKFIKDGEDADGYSIINSNTIQFNRELEAFGYNSSNPLSINISE